MQHVVLDSMFNSGANKTVPLIRNYKRRERKRTHTSEYDKANKQNCLTELGGEGFTSG